MHLSEKPPSIKNNNSIENRTFSEQHNHSSNFETNISNTSSEILNRNNSFQIDSDLNRIILNGNIFYEKYTSKDGHQTTYACKKNRGQTNSSCNAKIKILKNGRYIKIGAHSLECDGFQNMYPNKSNNAISEMLETADKLAMNHIAWPPSKIYSKIKDVLNDKYDIWYGATNKQIIN